MDIYELEKVAIVILALISIFPVSFSLEVILLSMIMLLRM